MKHKENNEIKEDFLDTIMAHDFNEKSVSYKWWSHILIPIIFCVVSILIICYLIRRSQLKVGKMINPFVHTSHCTFSLNCERAVQVNLWACILL